MIAPDQKQLNRPVGEFISPVDTTLRADLTVAQALECLRKAQIRHQVIYLYATDEQNRLVGVVPTRTMLLAEPGQLVKHVMNGPAISVPQDATLQEAMRVFDRHRLLALPVVDSEQRLLGILDVRLYAEEAVDIAEARHRYDLFQLIGVTLQHDIRRTALGDYRRRAPWLVCNLISGLVCALIAHVFRHTLANVLLLAMFTPLVLTLSESISMQSMTLTLQFLHGYRLPWRRQLSRLLAEWRTAVMLGASFGLAVGAMAMFWRQGLRPSMAIAMSILGAMAASATLGTTIPFSIHAAKLDPKVAAGPVVLMLADIVTMAIYLSLASWMLL